MYSEIKSNDTIMINRLNKNEKILLKDLVERMKIDELTVSLESFLDECGDIGGLFIKLIDRKSALTPEQIEALQNIEVELGENLDITYNNDVLNLDFELINEELIAYTDINDISFIINNSGELEVEY